MTIDTKASNKQIFKDVLTNLISSLSSNMFTYGLGLMLLNQTHSALSFGVELAIGPIISLLFMVPIGNLTDRLPHKRIIIMSMLIRILLLLILLLTIDYFTGMFKFIPISIFVTMNTIASVFASTAYTASVHELVNNQKIHQLSSLTSGANSLSKIFAPMLGIGVYAAFGFRVFVWIAMGVLLLSALIVTTMRFYYNEVSSNVDNVLEEKSALKNFQVGLIYVSKRPLIKMLIFVAVFLNFIFAAINIGLPYIINTQLSLNNALIGILDTFNALGGLVAALLLNFWPDNKGEKFKIIAPLFICSFYFILLGILLLITKNVHLISIIGGAIMFFGGFGVAMLNITTQVNIQKTTPTKILGRVTTIMTTACTIIMPIGTLIFTFIFQKTTNGSIVYLIAGIIWLSIMSVSMPYLDKAIKSDLKFQEKI